MFRTELSIVPFPTKLNHSNKILTNGSCFSKVIGEKLHENKFKVLTNPFGTIFNPISIFNLLEWSVVDNFPMTDSSIENKGIWFNYHVHSDFYGNNKEELELKLKEKIQQANGYLRTTDTLIITLGTAYVYKLKSTNEIVANCHKIPATHFIKELLTVKAITDSFTHLLHQFKIQNLKFKIILTVSPVRHTKDTLLLNSVSKSILRIACHELSEHFPEVQYFPSFEMMMDDLRDYRFYKEDMIHPTEVAEEYIWNKFSEAFFDEETKEFVKQWSVVHKALQHKPFRKNSEEYKIFLKDTLIKLEALSNKINVHEEIAALKTKIEF